MIHWDILGGRKFTAAIAAGATASVLCYLGKLSGAEYEVIILGTLGAYITGNVWQARQGPASDANRPGP